jgi:hypothetical protein
MAKWQWTERHSARPVNILFGLSVHHSLPWIWNRTPLEGKICNPLSWEVGQRVTFLGLMASLGEKSSSFYDMSLGKKGNKKRRERPCFWGLPNLLQFKVFSMPSHQTSKYCIPSLDIWSTPFSNYYSALILINCKWFQMWFRTSQFII